MFPFEDIVFEVKKTATMCPTWSVESWLYHDFQIEHGTLRIECFSREYAGRVNEIRYPFGTDIGYGARNQSLGSTQLPWIESICIMQQKSTCLKLAFYEDFTVSCLMQFIMSEFAQCSAHHFMQQKRGQKFVRHCHLERNANER